MAEFKQAVLTKKGLALLAKAQTDNTGITITKAVTGSGIYEDGEDVTTRTALKEQKQAFAPTTITRKNDTNVFIRFSITNNPSGGALREGYYVREIGIMANDPDDGEILYALAVTEENKADYLPSYNELMPSVIGVDFLIEVDNSENVTILTDLSAYATNADLNAKADGLGYDSQTHELQLKSNNHVISRVIIEAGGMSGSIASDEDVQALVDDLMSGADLPSGSVIATDSQVDSVINGFIDL